MARSFTSKAFVAAALLLAACAPSPVGPGLEALKGQNIRTAINYLGYPDQKQTIVGDTVYTWSESGGYTSSYPITDYDYGEFEIDGRRGIYTNTTRNYVSEYNTYNCKIKIATDERDVIKSTQASSSGGGCHVYEPAFEKLLMDFGIPLEATQ